MNYEKWLLNELLTKYENSKVFREGKSSRRVMYSINKDNKLASKFENIDEKYAFMFAINKLKEKKVIDYTWVKHEENNLVEYVCLNTEEKPLNEAYAIVGRTPKRDQLNSLYLLINEYEKRVEQEWIIQFLQQMKSVIEIKQSIPRFFTQTPKINKDILSALLAISMIKDEMLERVFSVKCYGDSKYFEKNIRGKVISIIKEIYRDEIDSDIKDDEVLNMCGIVKYPEVMEFRGNLKVVLLDKSIANYNTQVFGAYINSKEIENAKGVKLGSINKILFIENKANYISYIFSNNNPNELIIYHGGFYSPMKRRWFELIYKAAKQKNIQFYHWSDIDYGGFKLFHRLKTNIIEELKPLYMDKVTLENNINSAKTISSQKYCSKLRELLNDESFQEFHEVISYMLKYGVKLEQEVLI
ncbi:hypothetical protein lbkm_2615 [Lachnospiraceae bacterium KM106-2]|nr:hypothetical protein lbkm_2615 [Lachnospiraceae bacterium KM106-2]